MFNRSKHSKKSIATGEGSSSSQSGGGRIEITWLSAGRLSLLMSGISEALQRDIQESLESFQNAVSDQMPSDTRLQSVLLENDGVVVCCGREQSTSAIDKLRVFVNLTDISASAIPLVTRRALYSAPGVVPGTSDAPQGYLSAVASKNTYEAYCTQLGTVNSLEVTKLGVSKGPHFGLHIGTSKPALSLDGKHALIGQGKRVEGQVINRAYGTDYIGYGNTVVGGSSSSSSPQKYWIEMKASSKGVKFEETGKTVDTSSGALRLTGDIFKKVQKGAIISSDNDTVKQCVGDGYRVTFTATAQISTLAAKDICTWSSKSRSPCID